MLGPNSRPMIPESLEVRIGYWLLQISPGDFDVHPGHGRVSPEASIKCKTYHVGRAAY